MVQALPQKNVDEQWERESLGVRPLLGMSGRRGVKPGGQCRARLTDSEGRCPSSACRPCHLIPKLVTLETQLCSRVFISLASSLHLGAWRGDVKMSRPFPVGGFEEAQRQRFPSHLPCPGNGGQPGGGVLQEAGSGSAHWSFSGGIASTRLRATEGLQRPKICAGEQGTTSTRLTVSCISSTSRIECEKHMGFISTFIRKNHIVDSESASGRAARSPWSRKRPTPLQSVVPNRLTNQPLHCRGLRALRVMQNRGETNGKFLSSLTPRATGETTSGKDQCGPSQFSRL